MCNARYGSDLLNVVQPVDRYCLNLILELTAHLHRRLGSIEWQQFLNDKDEVDLTAYRVLHIGEACKRLSETIKATRPDVDWRSIIATRNILSHDYFGVDETLLWHAAKSGVPPLAAICSQLLEGEIG